MPLPMGFERDADAIYRKAVASLFAHLERLCEGAIAVDRDGRIVWISDKYRVVLGLAQDEAVVGRDIEDVIPNSLLRRVVETGEPILLDLMEFGERSFVVTRLPVEDESGIIIGAVGFVLYDRPDSLRPLVSKFTRLQEDLAIAKRQLAAERRAKYSFSHFIGSTPAVMALKRIARRAALVDTTVLLLGETGTGKELLAQAIHAGSGRAHKPFVGINVAAIPETLLEAEFFGVAPGAFTGADRRGRDGKFRLADGGTLFLDEIGDMPLHLQSKLLRVLQEQEIEPLGSNAVVRIDTRVIAATSRNLEKLVEDGKFRADLYFRLNVLPISLPPLRERLGDLEALSEVLLEQIAQRTGDLQREIDAAGFEVLRSHHWPGNVRELRNVLERAALLSDARHLSADDLAAILPAARHAPEVDAPAADGARPLAEVVAAAERGAILAALRAARGQKTAAARALGVSRSQLYEKMAQLGIDGVAAAGAALSGDADGASSGNRTSAGGA